jgi:hypothetical protein
MWVETQNMGALGMVYFGRIHGEELVAEVMPRLCCI